MKAVVYEKYGPPEVLEIKEVEKPVPKDNEVLIKVYATTVTAGDWRMRKASPFLVRLFNGLFRPRKVRILGFEVSGVIEETGKDVKAFKKGDPVFAFCGYRFGGYAEYRCLPEDGAIALKPANMTFNEAATVPLGSITAMIFLRKGGIKEGQHVMINGASGSVGTFAVQLAKHFRTHVTGVCSGGNADLVRSLGADDVVDYTKENIAALPKKFDLIFDAVGKLRKSKCRGILQSGGKFVTVMASARQGKDDLLFIKDLIESEELTTVIDRTYKLEEIREAHAYVQQFHKRGNVVVEVLEKGESMRQEGTIQ
jgi:NADPH:quinone reductase-like Zn-dependent oxidoreductase